MITDKSIEAAARAAYDAAPLVFGSWGRPARGTESSVTTAPVSWDDVQQDAASGDHVCAEVVRNVRRSARAAIAAFLEAQWEPIETAPKDGTWIIAYCDEAYTPTPFATRWLDGWRVWNDPDKFVVPGWTKWFPTHWQLMPAAPARAALSSLKEKG